jgi:hypothetical protein
MQNLVGIGAWRTSGKPSSRSILAEATDQSSHCDDGIMPLFCPTRQTIFEKSAGTALGRQAIDIAEGASTRRDSNEPRLTAQRHVTLGYSICVIVRETGT